MTDQDTLTAVAVGLVAGWWLWEHPAAARAIGWVVLFGLVCFGLARAQSLAPRRHHRRGYGQGHHRGRDRGG
jgi:hypothetical protein